MIGKNPSLDLVEYIDTRIIPQYSAFDKAHNSEHVTRVIRRSLDLARTTGADINMVYVIAAYHDLGMSGPRAIHHITSGKILIADQQLKHWFSTEQLKIMKEAVEDHRASASHSPRSIYGRIIAEADRDLDPEIVFRRTIQYGLDKYPQLDEQQQWERFKEHIHNKYSTEGYIHLWIQGSENEKNLNMLRNIISNEAELKAHFSRIYAAEK